MAWYFVASNACLYQSWFIFLWFSHTTFRDKDGKVISDASIDYLRSQKLKEAQQRQEAREQQEWEAGIVQSRLKVYYIYSEKCY